MRGKDLRQEDGRTEHRQERWHNRRGRICLGPYEHGAEHQGNANDRSDCSMASRRRRVQQMASRQNSKETGRWLIKRPRRSGVGGVSMSRTDVIDHEDFPLATATRRPSLGLPPRTLRHGVGLAPMQLASPDCHIYSVGQ